jgi:uncharacterized protein (DUF885 family)/putative intracellular protease/amidase
MNRPPRKNIILVLTLILLCAWAVSCGSEKATQAPPSSSPTMTMTMTMTAEPTLPAPTAEPTQVPTTEPEPTQAPTAELEPTEPPSSTMTMTAEPEPTEPPTAEPEPTEPPTPEPEPAEPYTAAAGELAAKLQGLSLDDFFEVSWRELMYRYPETIVGEGLSEVYPLETVELTNISDAYIRETYQMYAVILETLRTFDRESFSPERQVSFDVYEWYLDDKVREQEFMYYDYPATYFITSVQSDVLQFFTDLHPIANQQDAQDYVTRLGQVDVKFEQLLEGLKLREDAGIVPPGFATNWALYGLRDITRSAAARTPFYQALKEKLDPLSNVDPAQKQALLDAAEETINAVVIPAYNDLVDYLAHLESIAPSDDGLWQFPNGDAYYAYVLRHHTSTDMTPDEVRELGLQELDRIHAEMRAIFDALGYPQDESLAELFDRVEQDGGYIPAGEVLDTYTQLVQQADQNLDEVFDARPQAQIKVVASSIKGMYVSGSYDGSRPGAFHAGQGDSREPFYAMPTLAYHEAVPGHHFQVSLAQEANLPSFRRGVFFTAFVEGWALYAEQLAWELGWYEDDPYGDLGRLQAEAFRAARLVMDTGIHAQGWTSDQSNAFFTKNTGFESGDAVDPNGQTTRYIVWPGQATTYKIGQIKFLQVRQKAMEQLGEQFDIKEFHNVVLLNGPMPLAVLETVVDNYIAARLGGEAAVPIQAPAEQQAESSKTVLVIFGDRFIPEIYKIVPPTLKEAGYKVVIASTTLDPLHAKESDVEAQPDLLLADVRVQDYAAVIFDCDNDISFGGGRPETDRIAQEAVQQGKILAAICAAPRVLGYAGVVEGVNVTGEPSATCKELEDKYGATCTNKEVERDGLIITAKSRWSSSSFVNMIIQALQGQ